MKAASRHFFIGFGSILEIMPPRRRVDFSRRPLRLSQTERLAAAWNQVGRDMKTAIAQFEHERFGKKS